MLGGILKKLLGDKSVKDRKDYQPIIDKTNEIFVTLSSISDDELRARTISFQEQIAKATAELENEVADLDKKANDPATSVIEKESIFDRIDNLSGEIDKKIEEVLKDILPDAFATIKETARRWSANKQLVVTATDLDRELSLKSDGITIDGDKAIWANKWTAAGSEVEWNMVHYDVQLMGGAVLHNGNISEMQTGEGKTLVATLPVYLNALAGKGVHVVTVNDYLAKRDSEWMGPLYQFHGLTVDCIDKHQPNSEARKKAYRANITFGTNNEFGFDYLRDNMASDLGSLVQGKHHYAIIDEVDSVLIDDARTPLIISGPTPRGDQQEFVALKPLVEKVVSAQKALITKVFAEAKKELAVINAPLEDKKAQKTALEEGGKKLLRAYRGLPKNKALIKFLSEPGVKAHLQKTENFYMAEQNKQMPIIDNELYFVIDEKNNTIDLTDKGIDLISGNDDPKFYILPDIGSEIAELEKAGLTPEELSAKKDELIRDYSIKSERIHSINQLLKAYTLFEKEVEYVIQEGKVKIVDESTGRIMEGRRYSDGLHQAIEAKENVKVEAATQTYATVSLQNYFRMYHKLSGMTGTAETEAKEFWDIYELDVVVIPTNRPIAREDKNDLVYKTQREKFNAVIEEVQRLTEQNRPVLVGTTTVEISELLSRMLQMKGIQHNVLNAKHHQRESEIVAEAGRPKAVTIATNMAGRGTDIKLQAGVKEAGGLAIIGTERHDSRRVDRQLRGRAGRQGDPGSSQFFVSLEDDLMRKFGSERIARLMDRMGLEEGEVITHNMISKSIERAQKKVEENNFGNRKHLLEYDDVMNAQRKAIYKKRKNALYGDRLDLDIANMFYDMAETICNQYNAPGSFKDFELDLIRTLGIQSPVDEKAFDSMKKDDLINEVYDKALTKYEEKNAKLAQMVMPTIENLYQDPANHDRHIKVPFTDGRRGMEVSSTIKEAKETNCKSIIKNYEKAIVLGLIDNEWKEHLREMDDLKVAVRQAQYEQKDPLVIYKIESFNLFKAMMNRLNEETTEFLVKAIIPVQQQVQSSNQGVQAENHYDKAKAIEREASNQTATAPQQFQGSQGYDEAMANSARQSAPKPQPAVADKKIERNAPCPCGSGKKYKQCHGK
ncbi:preprotein translocase subunit SecA [Lishizhenia tianjinensis]|uniref:Protein translocase subunit SecA n=1 Tax=Lishizhenia tianjinensis TaxID=477690 RepID=A0A1I7AQ23_9FLAO|nr:preprotein translocase subunit SecA [Lishizhenia tianjinensis]SFT76995.1 preprotein translocase subunit SecA [Lishizhenia tianjinensis]